LIRWGDSTVTKPTGRPRGRPPGSRTRAKLPLVVAPAAQKDKEERVEQAKVRLIEGPIKLAPLEVMLANMDWAWNKAADMLREIVKDPQASPEVKLEAYREMMKLRHTCQHFAKDAAPYVHPPLRAKDAAPEDQPEVIDADPLRDHILDFAKFFNLPTPKEHTA